MSNLNKGLRYNKGKIRYGLMPIEALRAVAEVYTRGAHKYSIYQDADGNQIPGSEIPFEEVAKRKLVTVYDGANNWRKGLSWTGAMESVKRHIAAWEDGEDFDEEINTYHLANAVWGLNALLTYYKTYPQGDDRHHKYLSHPRIGLDIDEVLADWVGSWTKEWDLHIPKSWFFDREIRERFESMRKSGHLDDFYLSIDPLISPDDLGFEPWCYVTSRPVSTKITETWLDNHGFPARPVHTVEVGQSKVNVIKSLGIDIFIDDRFDNFVELNEAGICCLLYDAPHNRRYNVGYKRVMNFADFRERFL